MDNVLVPGIKILIKDPKQNELLLKTERKTDGRIGQPAQRHWQNGTDNIN